MRPSLYTTIVVACLATAVSPAYGASVDNANQEQKRAAQKMFEAADELYESGRYAEAAQAFRASHDLVASPNSRLMVARSLREIGKLAEAYREYVGTVSDAEASGGRYPEAQATANAEAAALRSQLAFLVVKEGKADSLRIGDQSVPLPQSEPIAVEPGSLKLELLAQGRLLLEEEVTLSAGDEHVVGDAPSSAAARSTNEPKASAKPDSAPLLPPGPAAEPNHGMRTAAYVAGGVGIAGLASFGVFGYLTRSQFNSLEQDCPDATCPPNSADEVDRGRLYQTVANVSLGVGVLGAALGTTLYFLSEPDDERSSTMGVRLAPGQISFRGDF